MFESDEAKAIALLFNAAIAKDRAAFCASNNVDAAALDLLRLRYAQPYIAFLEAMVRKASDEVNSW
jgi:hypothetical protein